MVRCDWIQTCALPIYHKRIHHPRCGAFLSNGGQPQQKKSSERGTSIPTNKSNECAKIKGGQKKEQRKNKKEKQKKNKRKTKETVSGRSPTTSASSSSPTDVERLNANVSSRDGLRKPQLTSTRHEWLPPESCHYKRKPASVQNNKLRDRQIRPHRPQTTRSSSYPPIPAFIPYPPEGV